MVAGNLLVTLAELLSVVSVFYDHKLILRVAAVTSRSAMAERPRELGDFKKAGVNGGTDNQSLKDSQFPQVSPQPLTDPHHMVIK